MKHNVITQLNENKSEKMQSIEEVEKVSPFDLCDGVEDLQIKIEKVKWLLSEWTQDYSFSNQPTLNSNDKAGYDNATKIVWEYERMFNMVDIAFDYVIQIKERLTEIEELSAKF